MCVVLLLAAPVFGAEPKLNVLFIAVDDLRPDLGCYGNAIVQSPNIDRLAAQGIQFNQAYCQLALCNPSRASLLSGRRPETLGVYDLATFLRKNNPDVVTLPELFKNSGYRTIRFGKIFHATNGNHDDRQSWSEKNAAEPEAAPAPASKGARERNAKKEPGRAPRADDPEAADHSHELPYGSPDVGDDALPDGKIARAAVGALEQYKDQPFFLAVGFHKPHLPVVAPKKYWDLYDAEKIGLSPNPAHPQGAPEFASNNSSELRRYKGVPEEGAIPEAIARNVRHGYYACATYVDAQIGKLLEALDKLDLRKNTIVILWGDHGYQLGDHGTWTKRTNWQIATRVPLILSAPGQKNAGAKTAALVELVDVYPTLAELCGLTLPPKLEGTSLAPLMADPERKWKTAAFSVYQKNVPGLGTVLGRAIQTERYRLIEWSAEKGEKRFYELYDHQNDPAENTNVADHPDQKQLVDQLTARLHAGWRAATPEKE